MRFIILALTLCLLACGSTGGGVRRKPAPRHDRTPPPETAPETAPEAAPEPQTTPPRSQPKPVEVAEPAPQPVDPLTAGVRVKVLEVIDGDTIRVRIEGKKRKVKFLGLRAPKADSSKHEVQYFGAESREYVATEILNRPVKLRFLKGREKDRFERYLAYVQIEGKDFNAKLIRKGYAWAQSGGGHPRKDEYERLEREARRKSRGMWARPPAEK